MEKRKQKKRRKLETRRNQKKNRKFVKIEEIRKKKIEQIEKRRIEKK